MTSTQHPANTADLVEKFCVAAKAGDLGRLEMMLDREDKEKLLRSWNSKGILFSFGNT